MEENLKLLIAHLEEEKGALRQQIDEAVNESEFLTAHQIQKGLRIVNEKLRILKSIQDPNFERKETLIRMREYYQRSDSRLPNGFVGEFMSRDIQRVDRELEILNSQPLPTLNEGDRLLEKNFLKLIAGEVDKLELHLQFQVAIIISFGKTGNFLQFSVKIDPENKSEDVFRIEYWKKDLRGFGFECLEEGTLQLCFLQLDSSEDIWSQVEQLLTRIYFEVFGLQRLEGNSFLKVFLKIAQ